MSSDDYIDGQGLPTQQWLEESFMEQLKGSNIATPAPKVSGTKEVVQETPEVETKDTVNREALLKELDDILDRLIDTIACSNNQSKMSSILTEQINRLSRCASSLGAPEQHFDPLDHLSGLQAPNLRRNAESVIENTKTCYQLGSIEAVLYTEDSNKMAIKFAGTSDDICYIASGMISGNEWQGNEAIDYVYTPGSGKMSVKAFEDGKWIDKSAKYDVSWELTETPVEEMKKGNEVNVSNNEGNNFEIIEE